VAFPLTQISKQSMRVMKVEEVEIMIDYVKYDLENSSSVEFSPPEDVNREF
jgi:hypothetical protein